MKFPLLILLALILSGCGTALEQYRPAGTRLSVEGDRFLINDRLVDIYGIRVASASHKEAYTRDLLLNLDAYKAHRVNAVTVFLQGSSGGYADPFSADGTSLDPEHLDRMRRIIEACDERGMVVIVGIFYQRTMANADDSRRLADAEAVRQAVRTATRELRGYQNIIINIANEQNSSWYQRLDFFDFNDPENIIALCGEVKSTDPERLVGGGGYHDDHNVVIGRSPLVDVLLFDTWSQDIAANQDSGWHYDYFVENGVSAKPIVNVELYGGWTRACVTEDGRAGFYSPTHKAMHYQDIDSAVQRPGLSVFLHSNPWYQGPSMDLPMRFDLGGDGTAEDPGVRWWFQYVREQTK